MVFEFITASAGPVLRITLSFTGTPQGQEEITVPIRWAGENLHAVTNLTPVSVASLQ